MFGGKTELNKNQNLLGSSYAFFCEKYSNPFSFQTPTVDGAASNGDGDAASDAAKGEPEGDSLAQYMEEEFLSTRNTFDAGRRLDHFNQPRDDLVERPNGDTVRYK